MRIIGLTIIENFRRDGLDSDEIEKDYPNVIKLNIPGEEPHRKHSIGGGDETFRWEFFFSDEQLFDLEKDGYIKLIVV